MKCFNLLTKPQRIVLIKYKKNFQNVKNPQNGVNGTV